MGIHTFELINGDWLHRGCDAVCSATLKNELDYNNLLEGLDAHATVDDKKLTLIYNDSHLITQAARHEIQLLTAKLGHLFVIAHSEVKRRGANIVRFRYTFERTV